MRQDAQRNRERIIAAAEKVFVEQGAAGSTHEVAQRAGVGIGTVFRHFPTKGELVEAVLIRHFARVTDQARSLAATSPPGSALRTLVREMIETGPTKVSLALLAGGREELSPGVLAASRELRAAVEVVLRRAQDAGEARPEASVDEVYLLVRSLAHGAAAMPVPAETLRRAADIILAGLTSPVSDLPTMTAMEPNAPRMPLVTGMNLAQAQAVIRTAFADLQVTVQHSDQGRVPPGMVIGQRPAAGNEMTAGTHIELTVAANPGGQERYG